MPFKKYVLPFVLILIASFLMTGSGMDRVNKASLFGKTIFFPITNSLRWLESIRQLQEQVNALQIQVVDNSLKNLALQNVLRVYSSTEAVDLGDEITDFEIAEVIGYSGQFHERSLIVNKGSLDGISIDNSVISAVGIIGKVIQTAPTYSIVLPLSNPQFQLPIMNRNTSVQGVLQADISGKISMNLIRLGSEIAVGDTVVTSNLSRLFPKGYPVGRVGRIKESQDNLFISAEIIPFTLIENLEHVFILKQRKTNEQS